MDDDNNKDNNNNNNNEINNNLYNNYKYHRESRDNYRKLRENLSLPQYQGKKHIAILMTGSFNPVHRGHLECFEVCKRKIEEREEGTRVVGGFISPSHDEYVSSKMIRKGGRALSPSHRCNLVLLALSSSSWVDLHDWEINQNYFADFPEVYSELSKELKTFNVELYFLCGSDHAYNCNLIYSRSIRTICVQRDCREDKLIEKQIQSCKKNDHFIFLDHTAEDISSTVIRERLESGLEIDSLTFPGFTDYFKENIHINNKNNHLDNFY